MYSASDRTYDRSVIIKAKIDSSTPNRKIILSWDNSDVNATKFYLNRKLKDEQGWRFLDSVNATVSSFTDSNLAGSNKWEYQIIKGTKNDEYWGYGYIYAGYDVEIPDYRGTALMLVDETIGESLKNELARYSDDLRGDGYKVARQNVERTEKFSASAVRRIKNIINYEKEKCNGEQLTIIIIGRVAVPYAGNTAWDGHPDHVGAWPADLFYATNDSDWTDENVHNISAKRSENRNMPHDGKFDQSTITSSDVRIGRIDFYNLPSFIETETELYRNYLNKNHNFRCALNVPRKKGLIDDGFKMYSGIAFAASAWMNFNSLVGVENIDTAGYMPSQESNSYLWSYSCNSGSYNSVTLSVYTDQLAIKNVNSIFTILLGSYFGDWDSEDNLMRATLASKPSILTCCWSGRPFWFFHHMALGEPIGYSAMISANNTYMLYQSTGMEGTRGAHINLMGDPTLRLKYDPKVANFNITEDVIISKVRRVSMIWDSPGNDVLSYRIYRSVGDTGKFEIIANVSSDKLEFIDQSAPNGDLTYMIRTVKKETSETGTYFNLNHGSFIKTTLTADVISSSEIKQMEIGPNPCSDYLNIYLTMDTPQYAELTITDLKGIQIYKKGKVQLSSGTNIIWLDEPISSLISGLYLIRIRTSSNLYLGKVSIIH
jgi:hypothetical protein